MDPVGSAAQQRERARTASLRRLHRLVRTLNGDLDLDRTLTSVCRGVIEGLGFRVAVVNLVRPDGDLEVVACEGDDGARAALLGQRGARDVWDAWLAACTPVGSLLVDYDHHDAQDVPTWVPAAVQVPVGVAVEVAVGSGEDAWHPEDALLAPLQTARSGLVGVLSVDLPEDGRRPGADALELLEMYAAQASVALDNALLHERLTTEATERSQTLTRLSAVVAQVPTAIVELDLAGRVRTWNRAAEQVFGWSAQEVLGGANPVADASTYDRRLRDLEHDGARRGQTTRRHRDGHAVEVEMTSSALRDETGRVTGYLGVYADVTERRRLERRLHDLAFQDPLTGLANRARLTERLDGPSPVGGLVLLDLDGFKAVNDTYGHAAGDAVLVEVAQRLRAACGARALPVRLGGDEFVALLDEGSPDEVDELAELLVAALRAPYALDGQQVRLGASAGAAVADGTGGRALLRAADVALYAAKAAGKGCVRASVPGPRTG